MSNIRHVLLEKLLEKDLSVYQLSKNLKIPKSRIYSWTQGRAEPKGDDTLKLVQFFKLVQIPINAETIKNGTSGNFVNEDGSKIKKTIMEDESRPPAPENNNGAITIQTLNRLLDNSSKLVDTNHILAVNNQTLVNVNYEQTLLIKGLVNSPKEAETDHSAIQVLAIEKMAKAGVPESWPSLAEGMLRLGRYINGIPNPSLK